MFTFDQPYMYRIFALKDLLSSIMLLALNNGLQLHLSNLYYLERLIFGNIWIS